MAVTVVVPGNWATAPARYVSFSAGTCHCPSGGRQANFDQIARDVTQPIFVMMGVASYRLWGRNMIRISFSANPVFCGSL